MTRCRCAECGNVLATERAVDDAAGELVTLIHPCGACIEEAYRDGVVFGFDVREPPIDESRD